MCVASWLAHNTLKSEVCRTNGDIVVICGARSVYRFQQSKPGEILQESDHLYLIFSFFLAYKSIAILSTQLNALESRLSLFCGNIQYNCSANTLLMG